MVTQLDSPDGKPRKDPDRPSPAFVETDDRTRIDTPDGPAPAHKGPSPDRDPGGAPPSPDQRE
ncbi:hypothetical protein [Paracidovorax konjaci]|uniref:Uncharacterized protein n=1 Tax=Paracidovorax konjaci TaxID=32040 RepID=A0A1I1YY52_9BURK|nr:hypothetical protein [Paracidovorax konjaci]SFE22960.1 hypothetical protein SAMN04489710_12034 [Paracidovorax konjaci]